MMSGAKGLSPTYEQAHVGLDLLTLASSHYTTECMEIGTIYCSKISKYCAAIKEDIGKNDVQPVC